MPIRVTAQTGVVFPAGQRAAVLVNFQASQGGSLSYYVRTYLSGAQQEQLQSSAGGDSKRTPGFQATKPFDAVELGLSRNTPGTQKNVLLYEFCSDAKNNVNGG